MIRWHNALHQLQQSGQPYVMVTVIGTHGSTPRDTGSKMIVTAEHTWDTIGGGKLEFKAIEKARQYLSPQTNDAFNQNQQAFEHIPLAAKMGQCCGGHTTLLFEYFAATGIQLVLFGAGHVGRAVATIAEQLPMRLTWIDSRAEEFPDNIAPSVQQIISDQPEQEVKQFPAGTFYLVMTHNHGLDFDIVEKVLKRNDSGYLGVIASKTKAKRFIQRLQHRGYDQATIDTMHSPIGLPDVPGKHPMEVAVSVCGDLIRRYHQLNQQEATPTASETRHSKQGIQWQDMKMLLNESQ